MVLLLDMLFFTENFVSQGSPFLSPGVHVAWSAAIIGLPYHVGCHYVGPALIFKHMGCHNMWAVAMLDLPPSLSSEAATQLGL
jgi:hypothetical protein